MAKQNNHPELDKWQKEIERLSFFEENAVNKKLFKYYRQALIDIKKEMKVFIENYETLSFSKRLEAERLLQNGKQIDKILRDMNKEVNNTIEKYVHGQAERGYYGSWYAMEGAHNIQLDMNMLPERYIKQLVHHPVKGQVFSKRLYKQRNLLAKETTTALLDAARTGKSYAVVAKQINELTEASYKRALRIARTEGGRVQSTAKQRSYVEAKKKGVDLKKKWLSTLDSKTRDTHQGLDGQVVEIEGKFVSPNGHEADGPRLFGVASEDIHCRCTTITEVNGMSPGLRRDNEGYEFPYRNYEEWHNDKKLANTIEESGPNLTKLFNISAGDRKRFAEDVLAIYGIDVSVEISKTNARGYNRFANFGEGHKADIMNFVLQAGDDRSINYQFKTVLHEAYHSKLKGLEVPISKNFNVEKWTSIEETMTEVASHYQMSKLSKVRLMPAYSDYLSVNLPRMQKLKSFENTTNFLDFGKKAMEYRFNDAKRTADWRRLHKELNEVEFDFNQYVRDNYIEELKAQKDVVLDMIYQNNPSFKEHHELVKNDYDGFVRHIEKGMGILVGNQEMIGKQAVTALYRLVGVKSWK